MRKKVVSLTISIFLILGLVAFGAGCILTESGDKIAVVPLGGNIADDSTTPLLTMGGITPKTVRGYLDQARNDPSVRAVVLRINSPGGSAAASQEIAMMVRSFKEDTGKPVVVSMGDTAASGGYYISVYADHIVANPSTATGSIGVISQFIYIDGLLEKLGLEMEVVKSGEYKDLGLEPLSEEERQVMQEILDNMYQQFIAAVAEGRGLSISEVEAMATGQIYTGEQALELGLVDELGGLDEAVAAAAELAELSEWNIVEYGAPTPSLLDSLLGLSARIDNASPLPLSDDQMLFLEILSGWQGLPRY